MIQRTFIRRPSTIHSRALMTQLESRTLLSGGPHGGTVETPTETATTAPADPHGVVITGADRGDANLDGTVNFSDLLVLASNYNISGSTWLDSSGDGTVNFADLLALASHYPLTTTGSFAGDWALANDLVPRVPTSTQIDTMAARRQVLAFSDQYKIGSQVESPSKKRVTVTFLDAASSAEVFTVSLAKKSVVVFRPQSELVLTYGFDSKKLDNLTGRATIIGSNKSFALKRHTLTLPSGDFALQLKKGGYIALPRDGSQASVVLS
ncbi:MAG: hypothetical protein QM770_02335 [Tepidisphaeraceae bacterium]